MEVDGTTQTSALTIEADPRISFPIEELQAQFDFHVKIRNTLSEITESVLIIRKVYDQIDSILSNAANNEKIDSVNTELGELRDKLLTIEYALTEPRMEGASDSFHYPTRLDNQFIILIGTIANSDRAPTQQSYEVYEVLKERGDQQLKLLNDYLETDVPRLNKKLNKIDLEPIRINGL